MIILTINGVNFLIHSSTPLSAMQLDIIESVCTDAYEDESVMQDYFNYGKYDNGEATIYDMTPYQLVDILQEALHDRYNIDIIFHPILREFTIQEKM